MQSVGDLGQNFGAAMLLARGLAQPGGFEQTAQLTGQDGGFGGEVVVKEILIGIMQKRGRADDFIEDHQRGGHQRTGLELASAGSRTWLDSWLTKIVRRLRTASAVTALCCGSRRRPRKRSAILPSACSPTSSSPA